jgi:hypothetical protein
MSTKIYDAYRIPKSVDILKVMDKIKKMSTTHVQNNSNLLKLIHSYSYANALDVIKLNPKDSVEYNKAKWFLNSMDKGGVCEYWIEDVLKRKSEKASKSILDVKFECSVFYDKRYWYIKFFPNSSWMYKVLTEVEVEIPQLEDYHYQNQSDPPDNIPYHQYEKRDEKWDELLGVDGNYRCGFTYTLFDEYEFRKLLTVNYYTGEKDLYKHLAYKFDLKFFETKFEETT